MRNSSIIIILVVMLLVGCGKKAVNVTQTQATPQNSGQAVTPSPSPVVTTPQKENQPNGKDLEKLIEKSNNTKDEKEREKVMAEIQKILEQAEKNAPKQN